MSQQPATSQTETMEGLFAAIDHHAERAEEHRGNARLIGWIALGVGASGLAVDSVGELTALMGGDAETADTIFRTSSAMLRFAGVSGLLWLNAEVKYAINVLSQKRYEKTLLDNNKF